MKVLVAEDDERLQRSLVRALSEHGYVVETAGNGADALAFAQTQDFDVVVLDVMMPALDGWTVLKRLRETKQTPVLVLTARDTPPDRVKGLDLGADDYLIKPFDLDELLARLRALIRRAAGGASNVIVIGDLSIDLRAKVVTQHGVTVSLTASEYRILEYLAVHRGRVVSRGELYDHLRGDEDDTFSNVMDVHVASIRRKLGPTVISTRRGQGYCVE